MPAGPPWEVVPTPAGPHGSLKAVARRGHQRGCSSGAVSGRRLQTGSEQGGNGREPCCHQERNPRFQASEGANVGEGARPRWPAGTESCQLGAKHEGDGGSKNAPQGHC